MDVVPEGSPAIPTGGYEMYTGTKTPTVPGGTAMERPVKYATPPVKVALAEPIVALVAEFAPATLIFISVTVAAVGEVSSKVS